MPQIKFGTVVTDMKGKANGSVFSSNRQGAYMRTNKSGGGKKSLSWENSKSRLAFLSTQWKALSLEQREQWNAIAPSYPALNKFNEPYTPSGYQVFMRLNGTLYAQDLPLLTVPNPPRSTPELSEIPVYSPENFCFTPTKTAFLGKNSNTISIQEKSEEAICLGLVSDEFVNDVNELKNSSIAMRFVLKQNLNINQPTNTAIPLFYVFGEENIYYSIYALSYNEKFTRLVFEYVSIDENDNTFVYSAYKFISNSLFQNSIHVGLQLNIQTPEESEVFFNGKIVGFDSDAWFQVDNPYLGIVYVESSTPVSKPASLVLFTGKARFLLGSVDKDYFYPYNVSDLRFLNSQSQPDQECENHEDCGGYAQCYMGICVDGPDIAVPCYQWNFEMWYFGYVLGSETFITSFDLYENGTYGSKAFNRSEVSFYYAIKKDEIFSKPDPLISYVNSAVCLPNNYTYIPMIYIQGINLEVENWMVQVLCSGMLSAGRVETQVPFKQIQCVRTNELSTLISPALRKIYGGFSPNADFYLKFNLLDSTTGATQNVSIPYVVNPSQKRKGSMRFKAGSDLSSSVN